ncbi:MAG: disulfide bond formation protein B [Pseudomonadota bacterium]
MLRTLHRRHYIALAATGSAVILATAFGFQYIGGLLPCAMCLWQRWPHAAAIVLGAVGAALPSAWIAGLGALSMVGNAGISLYHTGVERDWWEGPTSCSGGGGQDLGALSVEDLLNPEIGTGIVMCDEVAWEMLGLSMASWNGLVCLGLAAIWLLAARTRAA